MQSTRQDMDGLRKQLEEGSIQRAYRALISFMMNLRTRFANELGDSNVSGLYLGYMDMTYFSILPGSFKDRDLKIAIEFLYETFRFEIWLSGKNKQVLTKYWQIITKSQWNKYKIVEPTKGVDFVLEHILVNNPDFSDPDALTKQIEQVTLEFIHDIERFLVQNAA